MDWKLFLRQQAEALGVPYEVAYAIIQGESSGNPAAHNPTNTNGTQDYGLFQLNTGGQGAGMSLSALLNPITNIQTGLPPVARAYKAGQSKGLEGEALFKYTADHSGHASLDITHPGKTSDLFSRFVQAVSPPSNVQAVPNPWQAMSTALSSPPMTLITPYGARATAETASAATSAVSDAAGDAVRKAAGPLAEFAARQVAPFVIALILILAGVFLIASDGGKAMPVPV